MSNPNPISNPKPVWPWLLFVVGTFLFFTGSGPSRKFKDR